MANQPKNKAGVKKLLSVNYFLIGQPTADPTLITRWKEN
jgi:hypothetical protein